MVQRVACCVAFLTLLCGTQLCRSLVAPHNLLFHFCRQGTHLAAQPSIADTTNNILDKPLQYVDRLLSKGCGNDTSRSRILARIDRDHTTSCLAPSPLVEEGSSSTESGIRYSWIEAGTHRLAALSLEPALNTSSIAAIREAADNTWQNPETAGKSRFTYQRPGNYEAHLADLGERPVAIMNELLDKTIYPFIRSTFWNESGSTLMVYDSLVIRYNATEARTMHGILMGAGQPLHRDLGIVSFNFMLNSAEEFTGGGTFFENQLRAEESAPLRPLGVGHFLAHLSAERHAGAATVTGARDILVIFVSAKSSPPPGIIQNALLKQCRSECESSNDKTESALCRALHHRMAIDACPHDGEAFQYLGTAMMDYADCLALKNDTEWKSALDCSIKCLRIASQLTPCDSRVYNSLGLSLGRLLGKCGGSDVDETIQATYKRGLKILGDSSSRGCDVERDLDTMALNYGLFLANQDRFLESVEILAAVAKKGQDGGTNRIQYDAFRLWTFCRSRI